MIGKNTNEDILLEERRQKLREQMFRMLEGKVLSRDLRLYLAYFNLKIDEMRNKKILDVGAGAGIFSKHALKKGLDVTPVDPLYFLPEGRDLYEKSTGSSWIERQYMKFMKIQTENPQAFAEIAQNLSFKSKSFDMLFSVYSSYFYELEMSELEKTFNESMRVLKPGGKLFLFPFIDLKSAGIHLLQGDGETFAKPNTDFMNFLREKEKKEEINIELGNPHLESVYNSQAEPDAKNKRYAIIKKLSRSGNAASASASVLT